MTEMIERVAKAIISELRNDKNAFVEPYSATDKTAIDGTFDLNAVARSAIAAMSPAGDIKP